MITLLSVFGGDFLWLLACMAIVAAVIATITGLTQLGICLYRWRIDREIRALDDPLPKHRTGPVNASRRHRRQLHRDLVLLLVVNTDHEDA